MNEQYNKLNKEITTRREVTFKKEENIWTILNVLLMTKI